MPIPTLETERLLLRGIEEKDLAGWATLVGDPESARFIGGVVDRAAAWRGMAAMAGSWQLKGFGMFSVVEKSTGRWIGRLGPWQPEGWPGTEIGWGLVREAWGKGYAAEGATAAIDWAFANLEWTEVIHVIDPRNSPSIALAERLGSAERGPCKLPPPFENLSVKAWGQTKDQWFARRPPRAFGAPLTLPENGLVPTASVDRKARRNSQIVKRPNIYGHVYAIGILSPSQWRGEAQ